MAAAGAGGGGLRAVSQTGTRARGLLTGRSGPRRQRCQRHLPRPS